MFDFGVSYKERSNTVSPIFGIPLGPADLGIIYQMNKTTLTK
ncbi:hypothetical protein C943_00923 [Mariniradius saccharolyticus AK6]|uniref:Uncharacterized protein n=1 Tax=Mariniradius saccharolyticus AK6 TaxID=1239962 RepID=M7Y6R4_9BACT|nr:hypothetical protein C943_00923 [Mariniradius saccharolyticus AK6]